VQETPPVGRTKNKKILIMYIAVGYKSSYINYT
jgi:hypothetical protein